MRRRAVMASECYADHGVSKHHNVPSMEALLTSPHGFQLTQATPVQRAICRVIDGLPLGDLWDDSDVRAAFDGALPPEERPFEVLIASAIRCGKSLISACAAFRNAMTADCSMVGDGETPRVAVVSVKKDNAHQTFSHLDGKLRASKHLRSLVVKSLPGKYESSVWVRRPHDGIVVEIKVVAGSRGGESLISRWLASVIFDEASHMDGSDSGRVINLSDQVTNVRGRILPGGQILYPTSPWGQIGPIPEMVDSYWGRPSDRTVVIRGTGPSMNPSWWTEDLMREVRARDERAYRRDCLALFDDPPTAYFDGEVLKLRQRHMSEFRPLMEPNWNYVAAMDPATRQNSWTLIIWGCRGEDADGLRSFSVVRATQWSPTKTLHLEPDEVFPQIAQELGMFGLDSVYQDQWSADSLVTIGRNHGVHVIPETIPDADYPGLYRDLRTLYVSGRIDTPLCPELIRDLRSVREIIAPDRTMRPKYKLPKTPDGRHCDYVPPMIQCLRHAPEPPSLPGSVNVTSLEARRRRNLERTKNRALGIAARRIG